MAWKATGEPMVRRQRDKWVVRIDGIDTETGKVRPRQVGTYASQRSALAAARSGATKEKAITRDTVGWLIRRYVESRTDVTEKAREQYRWAIPHIDGGLGAIRLDRLDRDDVARWLESIAKGGTLSRRSVQICRNVLKAALADAVDEGLMLRSPAARVPLPRTVAKPAKVREVDAWSAGQVATFLATTADHRWAIAFRLCVLYGLRRSEVLALKWDDIKFNEATLRIDEGLVPIRTGPVWTEAKNARSRRTIHLDRDTVGGLARRRREQAAERVAVGPDWEDFDLVIATRTGGLVLPRTLDRVLERMVTAGGLPRLTSHGLRHTAATHMVRSAADVGELRAIADILGHSPEILLTVYAHTLPQATASVTERIGARARASHS